MKYYYIEIKAKRVKNNLYFTGSMFRGALGYALKKVVCINPSFVCDNCFAANNCLFYEFYEKKNAALNYRLQIELGREEYSFGLYLFNNATDKLPYVLSAIHKMFTEQGLGRDKEKVTDFTIKVDGQEVYDGKEFKKFDSIEKQTLPPADTILNEASNVHIKLKTPLRIKKNNRFLRDNVEIEDILRSINQRYIQLSTGENYATLNYTPSYNIISKSLRYQTLIRKSNRQKTKMNMDGVMGELVLANVDSKSLQLLKIGEIIGVGKQTVFGLGEIEVKIF